MKKTLLAATALVSLAVNATNSLHAQQPAFPGAYGFGEYASGGRGGTIVYVTNTNDSGAGSFRSAVGTANSTVLFSVGGTITLASAVSCADNLTIAGQTAPGGGIAIIGHEVSFSLRSNEIVRHVRFRPGSIAASTEDAVNMGDGTNMIFDHCSLEFAPYNNIDASGSATESSQITIQNSILADPIGQQFNAHTDSGANGGNTFSWVNNIFDSGHDRNPLAKTDTIFVNNVVYNFQAGYTVANTAGNFLHDIVGNYFIVGPATTSDGDDFYQMDDNQTVYASGNLEDTALNGTLTGSAAAPSGVTNLASPWSSVTTTIPTLSAASAVCRDVSLSGAQPRDQVDALIQADVLSYGTAGAGGGLWTSQTSDGLGNDGYGVIANGTAPALDSDGLPAYFEVAMGLNTNANNANTVTSSGYTYVEVYINWLAGPHAFMTNGAPVAVNLSQYTAGFISSPSYSVADATDGSVSLNGSTATFTANSGFSGMGSFNFTVTDSAGDSMTQTVTVLVTPATGASAPATPTGLSATAGNAQVILGWNPSTGATGYPVDRALSSGGPYSPIALVTNTGYTNTGLSNGTLYFYTVAASNSAGVSAFSAYIGATPTNSSSGGGLPSPWTTANIGAVGVAGGATDTNGLFTVKGSGANIWNGADTFFYVYQPATNNYTISAKVLSVQDTGAHAKGGVMIRATPTTNSAMAMVDITPSAGVEFVWRTTTGGSAASTVVTGITAPNWVQLTRSGSTFTGYYSTNGTAWIAMATNTITMATNAYIGLPVCAYNNATNCTATFTNVVLTP